MLAAEFTEPNLVLVPVPKRSSVSCNTMRTNDKKSGIKMVQLCLDMTVNSALSN